MAELFIGPFLVPNQRKGIVCPEVEEAGYTLELATPQRACHLARKHADLMDRPRELAILMRKAQLYSETTATSNILKSLPAIIAEARKGIGP